MLGAFDVQVPALPCCAVPPSVQFACSVYSACPECLLPSCTSCPFAGDPTSAICLLLLLLLLLLLMYITTAVTQSCAGHG